MSQSIISTFQRFEVKYLLTPTQLHAIMPTLGEHFRMDEYGRHTINNIFYDTEHMDIIRESISKPPYKEKLRLRSYGTPVPETGQVFLEIKKKYDGIVYKRRIAITVREAEDFLARGIAPPHADPQITHEIAYFLKVHGSPVPRTFIAYDREAYADIDNPELRITLDRNLRWRDTELDLCAGSHGQLLIPEEMTLMEIKIPGTTPLWLAHLLSENGVFSTSFSKIGACYKEFLLPKFLKESVVNQHV